MQTAERRWQDWTGYFYFSIRWKEKPSYLRERSYWASEKGEENEGERNRDLVKRKRACEKPCFIHWKYHFLGIALASIQLTFHTDKKPCARLVWGAIVWGAVSTLLLFRLRLRGGRIIWILTIELLKNNPFLSPSSISFPTSTLSEGTEQSQVAGRP